MSNEVMGNMVAASIVSFQEWQEEEWNIIQAFCTKIMSNIQEMDIPYMPSCSLEKYTGQVRGGDLTPKRLQTAMDALRETTAKSFNIKLVTVELVEEELDWTSYFNINIAAKTPENANCPQSMLEYYNAVDFCFSPNLLPIFSQQEITYCFHTLCRQLSAVTGVMDYTKKYYFYGPDTVMERYSHLEAVPRFFHNYFNEKVRGYGFANWLTKGHIKALGGIDKIRQEAPVDFIEVEDEGAVYLQICERMEDITPQRKRQLREYFEPIVYPLQVSEIRGNAAGMTGPFEPMNEDDLWDYGLVLSEKERQELNALFQISDEDYREKVRIETQEYWKKLNKKQPYKRVKITIDPEVYEAYEVMVTLNFIIIGDDDKLAVEQVIEAWQIISLYDGFSKKGIKNATGIEWDDKQSCCFIFQPRDNFKRDLSAFGKVINRLCELHGLELKDIMVNET
ncbi:hypothetical protein LJC20_06285 [Eubacteriales bacterium OttesenSCG-928-M02]|nr:hypothetical protein [Eubacteriales bacterium OttesenSCG-928-M02]